MFVSERFWASARKFGPVGLVERELTWEAYAEEDVSDGSEELEVTDDSESDSAPES